MLEKQPCCRNAPGLHRGHAGTGQREDVMDYRLIIAKVSNREGVAQDMQRILTDQGCLIKVRLGLHDIPANTCSPAGLVVMEVEGEEAGLTKLVSQLSELPGVFAKYLVI